MQFSMIFEAQTADPSAANERVLLKQCVEQAVFAEAMGFDRIWAVEHHSLKWYAHMSAPETFLAYVAARTERIRVGHGVVCMPFNYNHPIRVAERAAMLDVLSDGRLDLGAGRGATMQEMSAMGVNPDDTHAQVEEALRMIGHMWVDPDGDFEWHGKLMDVDPHPILPRPVQLPHPPLYLACTRNDTVRLAAEYGIGALVLGFSGPDEIAKLSELYRQTALTRTGELFVSASEVNDHLSALCPTVVLEDRETALDIGIRGQKFFAQAIAYWYGGGPPPSEAVTRADARDEIRAAEELHVAHLHEADIPVLPASTATFNPDHAYGSAADAIAYVERLADAGVDEIMCLIQMGTVPHEAAMETIRLWGASVIPHFRARLG